MTPTIFVSAFQLSDDGCFYDAITGAELKNFQGFCLSRDYIFKTFILDGERHWLAIGNNPKYNVQFISHAEINYGGM